MDPPSTTLPPHPEPYIIHDESEAIAQLQQMKSLSEGELRKQISAMNPEWKDEVTRMNHQ